MFRRRNRRAPRRADHAGSAEPIDLHALEPPWRDAVNDAMQARARFQAVLVQCREGPLRDHLSTLGDRVDSGVLAAWATANRAQAAARAVGSMGLEQATDRLKDARRRLAQAEQRGDDTAALDAEVAALAVQHASLHQLSNAVDDAAERLRLLDIRLGAAVARAAQIVLAPDAADQVDALDGEIVAVVEQLEALRAGLDAAGR
jgi:hypothetical protein